VSWDHNKYKQKTNPIPMIKQLSITFGSKTKAQEILLLQNDVKPVVRQGYYEHELPRIEKYCKANSFHLVKSKFKVLLLDETNYSNKGIRMNEKDKRPGMYFVYISKDEEKAWLAAYYELMQNDKDLGLTLGYPKCCVQFFLDNFSKRDCNPEHPPANPWTNLSKRKEDHVLLSHFPCSSTCPESVGQAKDCLDIITQIDRERAEEILTQLKC